MELHLIEELDPIDEARLLGYAYESLKEAEGWHQEMLDQFKKIVLRAEEKEVRYTMEQDYLVWQEAKTKGNITDKDMEDMADYYESKGEI